jgi:hypothetical protein
MEIREKIIDYIKHKNNIDYLEFVLASADLEIILDEIEEILRSENGVWISIANLFIRDAALLTTENIGKRFKERIRNSYVIEILNSNIFSQNHFIRYDSIYTIGKLDAKRSTNILIDAFHAYKESDPIILPGLVFELFWLQDEDDWAIVKDLLPSRFYITRWSSLRVLEHTVYRFSSDLRPINFKKQCIELLMKDENHLIKQEAEYQYQRLKCGEKSLIFSKKEKRQKLKKEIEVLRPRVCFTDVQIQFTNYLHINKRTNYTIDELEDFAEKLAE